MTGWCHSFAVLTVHGTLKVVTKGIESVETGPSSRDVCVPHRWHCARLRWRRKIATASSLRELIVWSISGKLREVNRGIEGVREIFLTVIRRRPWR